MLDVGANEGQYGSLLRNAGYRGKIVSFEPSAAAYAVLERTAAADPLWQVMPRVALSDRSEDAVLHIAGNSASSSLLRATSVHDQAAPHARTVSSETVRCERLDALAAGFMPEAARILLKLDTQGTEDRILDGAAGIMPSVYAIQTELSFAPLYDNQADYLAIMQRLTAAGFRIFSIHPNFFDSRNLALLQCDAFFVRSDAYCPTC